jgi:hypothetical protein
MHESGDELWASVRDNYSRHPMVFPDLPEVQIGGAFGRDGGMRRNEVRMFSYAVNDVHNCVISMGLGQFNYEVNTDRVPWCRRCLRGMELTEGSSMLQLRPITQVAGFDVDANVVGHLWPPIVARYELQGLEVACMSGDARIMVLLNDMAPKVFVIGDMDLTAEHE